MNVRVRPAAFTLIEMLVVIAIVSVLIALLLPAVQSAREAARRTSCENHLKQLGLAMHNFQGANNGFPRLRTARPAHGWGLDLLPYLEQEPIRKHYQTSESFASTKNAAAVDNVIGLFLCPSSPVSDRKAVLYDPATNTALTTQGGASDYFAHSRVSSVRKHGTVEGDPALSPDGLRDLAGILDGTSQTILLSEVAMRPDHYVLGIKQSDAVAAPQFSAWAGFLETELNSYDAAGRDVNGTACAINCNNDAGIYAFHPGGANTLFCDGSVHHLSAKTCVDVVLGLATRNGSEMISETNF
jgi:prepilin-type N-terminal cleavage/methylation domain-containing protein/prepilin-type processing-associated H-X9-DG protein